MKPVSPLTPIPSVARFGQRQTVQQALASPRMADTLRGRPITWELVQVPADKVELATIVWLGNERCQALLKPANLTHITATLGEHGNDEWAKGRRVNGLIEVADGSCRRAACIEKARPFNILICDELTDEDMAHLSAVGNQYRQPSPWEKGRHYARLERMLGSLRQVEQHLREHGERISRRTISRCIKTAELPIEIIQLLDSPSSLGPDAGAELAERLGPWLAKEDALAELLAAVPEVDESEEAELGGDEQVIAWLRRWQPARAGGAQTSPAQPSQVGAPRSLGLGTLQIKGRTLALRLDRAVPQHDQDWLTSQLETLMVELALPAALRGRGMTQAMMEEYQQKVAQTAEEFGVSPAEIEQQLVAAWGKAMAADQDYRPERVALNIRVMRGVIREAKGGA